MELILWWFVTIVWSVASLLAIYVIIESLQEDTE
jgi:hypothetical protein